MAAMLETLSTVMKTRINRYWKAIIHRIRGGTELDEIIPAEIFEDSFYEAIYNIAKNHECQHILEIGSSAGGGSTGAFVHGLSENNGVSSLYCMEISQVRYRALCDRYKKYAFVKCYNVSSIKSSRVLSFASVGEFYKTKKTKLNKVKLETVEGWLKQDIKYMKEHPTVDIDGIKLIKEQNGISQFDLVLIDGSAFTGAAELDDVYGARIIMLDDVDDIKNYDNYHRLKNDPEYTLTKEDWSLRNGFAVFERVKPASQ